MSPTWPPTRRCPAPPAGSTVKVDGVPIAWWQVGAGPPVVLAHGASASSMWWHAVLPRLADHYRVIALDLSGHGDSGRRERYDVRAWSREIAGVVDAAGADDVVLVGHSLGGRIAAITAADRTDRVTGLVQVDSFLRDPARHVPYVFPPRRPVVHYSTFDEAAARFKLLPDQPRPPAKVLEPVIRHLLRHDAGRGWTWKYDSAAIPAFDDVRPDEVARRLTCPVAYIWGARSAVVNAEMAAYARATMPVVLERSVPQAHHHLILDHPDEAAEALLEAIAAVRGPS
jgi:pimeloyl-ACP methyl ester carboxylesterase